MHNSVGGGDSRWTRLVSHFSDLRDLDLDLDLLSSYTAFRCVSLIDFYLHTGTKFSSNRKNFFCGRTKVRTYGQMDVRIETGVLTRLYCVDSEKSTYTQSNIGRANCDHPLQATCHSDLIADFYVERLTICGTWRKKFSRMGLRFHEQFVTTSIAYKHERERDSFVSV